MERSAGKPGDGKPWTPEIKVKGGNSAFYSIGVGKGGSLMGTDPAWGGVK